MDFTLGFGSPDPDISGAVSPAWVHLRRSTVVSEVRGSRRMLWRGWRHHVSEMVLKEIAKMGKGEN
jgi:hypothetical protein